MDITYEKSGVNIDVADDTKREIAKNINNNSARMLNKVGAFASLYDFSDLDVKNPVLVLKTEEPGSKQKLSIANGKVRNICYDMINHLTNDIIVMGATPLTVQDAIICGKLEKEIVTQLVKYIAEACRENGCVLTGGETSEQPNVLDKGIYVLTSSIVGVVDKTKIIDGSKISVGDTVLALASNGIHTNGYSLLRMLMSEYPAILDEVIEGESFMDVILRPHRAYYKELSPLFNNENLVGMAHITGGGIIGNLNRILPPRTGASIDISAIKILDIFKLVKQYAKADDSEMLRTFNMGVGMTIVVKAGSEEEFYKHFGSMNMDCYKIGEITAGNQTVVYNNQLDYTK